MSDKPVTEPSSMPVSGTIRALDNFSQTGKEVGAAAVARTDAKGRFVFPSQPGLGVVYVKQGPTAHHMAKIIRFPAR